MPTRYMQGFFDPRPIAVIGASERDNSLGGTVLQNLLDAGYPGTRMAVNRHGDRSILGFPRNASVADLPEAPVETPAKLPRMLLQRIFSSSFPRVCTVYTQKSKPTIRGAGT